jgi:hypothetical protein
MGSDQVGNEVEELALDHSEIVVRTLEHSQR